MSNYNHNDYRVYEHRKDHTELPALDVALHPSEVHLADDISDQKQFNKRFIESRLSDKEGSQGLYVAMAFHNFFLLIALDFIFGFFSKEPLVTSLFELPWPVVLFYVGSIGMVYFTSTLVESAPIRFNRQAQLVHFRWDENRCLSIPWREVTAFSVRLKKGAFNYYVLRLHFPRPKHIDLGVEADNDFKTFPLSGMFDDKDSFWMFTNIWRYEFIRRYMEVGLSAIQPDKELLEKNLIKKPSGSSEGIVFPFFTESRAVIILNKVLIKVIHLLVFGPLIDFWIKRKISRFQWPEEIERLCAEGADLSAFNITCIKTKPNIYYRYNQGSYEYIDKNKKYISY